MRSWATRPGLLVAGLLLGTAVGADPLLYAESDFARVEKIDTHVHLYGELPKFMERASADNFRLLTINVNYRDFPPVRQQFDDARALQRAYPDRIALAATFDDDASESNGWLERPESHLSAALD